MKTQRVKSKAGKYYYYKYEAGNRVKITKAEYYDIKKPDIQKKALKKAYKINKAKVIVTKRGVINEEALTKFLSKKNVSASDEAKYKEIANAASKVKYGKRGITEAQLVYRFKKAFQKKTNKRMQAALSNIGVDAETFAKMYGIDYNEFIKAENWEDGKFTDEASGITWELVYDYTDTAYLEPIDE